MPFPVAENFSDASDARKQKIDEIMVLQTLARQQWSEHTRKRRKPTPRSRFERASDFVLDWYHRSFTRNAKPGVGQASRDKWNHWTNHYWPKFAMTGTLTSIHDMEEFVVAIEEQLRLQQVLKKALGDEPPNDLGKIRIAYWEYDSGYMAHQGGDVIDGKGVEEAVMDEVAIYYDSAAKDYLIHVFEWDPETRYHNERWADRTKALYDAEAAARGELKLAATKTKGK